MANQKIELKGRVFLKFYLRAVTGLHIGGSDSGIEIGGVDKTVIRDPITNRPYIPGSSLKGKMRSLLEKYNNLEQNQRIGQGFIHSCDDKTVYRTCNVCQTFGVPGERDFSNPTRLVVRDVFMDADSAKILENTGRTDLPYTEIKTEVSIDRVTSAANPRQMERVPADTVFGPAEMVYTIYNGSDCDPVKDVKRLTTLVEGLQLLEDDYLGGLGSRGSGKVKLVQIEVSLRSKEKYLGDAQQIGKFEDLQQMVHGLDEIQTKILAGLGLA
jgi:CRISPR-associated protein Csm3